MAMMSTNAGTNNNDEKRPPKLLTLPSGEQIPYHSTCPALQQGTDIKSKQEVSGVLFCNGFRSVMTGNKALALQNHCQKHYQQLSFTRFDYRGHGDNYNDNNDAYFETLGLTDWIADARAMLCHCYNEQGGPQLVVGSSMGVWIAIQLALLEPTKVAGILGIAAAPDFTQDIWERLTCDQQRELQEKGLVLLPSQYSSDNAPYPISHHLLQDGSNWLLLKTNKLQNVMDTKPTIPTATDKASEQGPHINVTCPVRLIHGQQDVDIPWQKSIQLANAVASEDVHVTLIKNGDHRLSKEKDLQVICRILDELVETIRGG